MLVENMSTSQDTEHHALITVLQKTIAQACRAMYRSAGKKFHYEGEEHTIEETSESRCACSSLCY